MTLDISTLADVRKSVEHLSESGSLAGKVVGVEVLLDEDSDVDGYLKVEVTLLKNVEIDLDDLQTFLELVEGTVIGIADRYPSVRFLEAA